MQSKSTLLLHPQQLLSSIITCLTQLISQSQIQDHSTSVFNLKAAPTISIADYLSRMFKYMNSSISIFVYALVLIDRVQEYNPLFILHKKNVHRIMLAANVVAAKYLDDFYYKNSFYASVGGVNVKVLNQLEVEFLTLIQFNAEVGEDMFMAYLERLDTFGEVNRQGDEKENCRGMKSVMEKKSQLKKKDSNVDNGTVKITGGVKSDWSRQKSDEMVKPQTQQ